MNTVIKTLDLSELPFQFEGASVRIKYLNKDNKGKMIIPTSENYLVEVYPNQRKTPGFSPEI